LSAPKSVERAIASVPDAVGRALRQDRRTPGPNAAYSAAVTICPAPRWTGVRREHLKHLLIGAAIALAVAVPLGAFGFVKSGLYNVAASKPHSTLTFFVTHETMVRSVKRHAASIAAPQRFTGEQVLAGFCTYETHCVACHGAAGIAREQWVSGLEPQPPWLLDATEKWTPAQLFWIAKNGIKMTGMPSWRDSLSDAQIWEVVAWIEASRRLPPRTYARWRARSACGSAVPGPVLPPQAPRPRR
jgi:mono/diheme cytochrome c family protein